MIDEGPAKMKNCVREIMMKVIYKTRSEIILLLAYES